MWPVLRWGWLLSSGSWKGGAGVVIALGGIFLASGGAWSAQGETHPSSLLDPKKGQINGRVAIAVFPASRQSSELRFPAGYSAHLVRYDDPETELVFPCGEWFQPPPGSYRHWVEGEWEMSPFSLLLSYSAGPFRGRGMISAMPLREAGKVTLPERIKRSPSLFFRVLHAGSYAEEGFLRWELSRRAESTRVGGGLQLPTGPAIAGLWDRTKAEYVAISRPFEVLSRKSVAAPLGSPTGSTAHLVVLLERHRLSRKDDPPVVVSLKRNGVTSRPAVLIEAADRLYAMWYDLKPGVAEVSVDSGDLFVDGSAVKLRGGRIERAVARLRPVSDLFKQTKQGRVP